MIGVDRRRAPRREPHQSEPASKLRLRTGRGLDVVNIGPAGVLVETTARLLPGTCVDVHVILSADRIVYRGALAFDRLMELAAAPPGSLSGGAT